MITGLDMSVRRAADWVREKYHIPISMTVTSEFEKEFKCKVIFDDFTGYPETVKFESDLDELIFLLRFK